MKLILLNDQGQERKRLLVQGTIAQVASFVGRKFATTEVGEDWGALHEQSKPAVIEHDEWVKGQEGKE